MKRRVNNFIATGLESNGNVLRNGHFFDTLKIKPSLPIEEIKVRAEEKEINLRYFADGDVRLFVNIYYVKFSVLISFCLF